MFSIIRSGFFLLALLALAIPVEAQVSPAQTATAAISGHVTHSGQPVPGVTITLEPADSHTARASLPRTITNEQGTYRLAAVPEGRYIVRPIAPAFVLASGPDSDKAGTGVSSGLGLSGFVVTLAKGDAVEGIDFALEAGGVITGRVIDDAGRPVVALSIECQRLNEQGQLTTSSSSRFETDDRGIYRIYGLPTGKYQVAVSGWDKSGSKPYRRTFHPDTTDPKRGELVEVTAGVESSGIDIRLGHPQQFFSITGRLIDQDTGKPVSGVTINSNGMNDGSMGFATTSATGMFKIENCVLGSYEIKIATTGGQTQGYYTDPVVIPVSDADVTDLEINAVRGATVSGSVIVVGSKDPTVVSAFALSAMIATNLQPGVRGSARSAGATVIDPAGRFEFTGLRPGKIEIRPMTLPQGFTLLRIEYNGAPVRDGLTVSAGERITGLRVLVTYGTGSIRGEIKVEGGTLPTRMDWLLTIRRIDGDGEVRNEMIDARGRFWLTDLAPGQYEITAEADYVEIPGVTPKPYPGPIKQTVSVVNKSESQVLLVLALGR